MNIYIEKKEYDEIINHCKRKLNGTFYSDETKEKQAFGVIIGETIENGYRITKIFNLKKNYRFNPSTSKKVDDYIKKYAISGGMEIKERAWSIDPIELNNILISLTQTEKFLGTYHMHSKLSWKGDYPKDLPTVLDRKLNENSELINLIVSIGDYENKIRAFYESDVNQEYNIIIKDEV